MAELQTLADFKALGYRLTGNCGRPDCGRGRELDIDALIARFGADHPVIGDTRIAAALRCACGHKGGSLTVSAIDTGPRVSRPGGRS